MQAFVSLSPSHVYTISVVVYIRGNCLVIAQKNHVELRCKFVPVLGVLTLKRCFFRKCFVAVASSRPKL